MDLKNVRPPVLPEDELKRSRCLIHKIDIVGERELFEWVGFWESIQHDAIGDEADAEGLGWVFRGQSDPDWMIASSIERRASVLNFDVAKLNELEKKMVAQFKQRVFDIGTARGKFGNVSKFDSVTCLSVMQHYGLPTRLIDFTFSPMVALYMAARDALQGKTDNREMSVWAVYRGRYPSVYGSRFPFLWARDACSNALCTCDNFGEALQRNETTKVNVRNGYVSNRLCGSCLIENGEHWCVEKLLNFPVVLWIVGVESEDINVRMRSQRGLFMMPTSLERSSMAQLLWQPFPCAPAQDVVGVFASRGFAKCAITADLVTKSHLFQFRFCGSLQGTICKLLEDKNINEQALFPDVGGEFDRVLNDVRLDLKEMMI